MTQAPSPQRGRQEKQAGAPSCLREFARYASLNVLGMIALSCYILADTYFISLGMGANGLAALNLAIPVYSFIHGSGLMIGMGGGTRYSIRKNQGDDDDANRAFTTCLFLAAGFAAVFVLLGLFAAGPLAALLGADGAVFDMTCTYLRVILLFAPAFLANNLLLCFVRNDGAPQRAMAGMIAGSLSNVVLDYLFIFPCGMGIFGAALATGFAPLISMAVLSPYFFRRQNRFHPVRCPLCPRRLTAICAAGAPSLVTEVSSGVVMIAFNAILLRLEGNVGVAAYGVIANLSLVVLAIFTGVSQGIQPLLSARYGAGRRQELGVILRYALTTALAVSAVVYALIFAFAGPIADIFNSEHNAALRALAEYGLRLYFIACPFAGCNIILAVYFTSVERPRPGQALSLLRGFVLILPMAFALSALFGLTGVWCAFPVTEALVSLAGAAFYRRSLRPALRGSLP